MAPAASLPVPTNNTARTTSPRRSAGGKLIRFAAALATVAALCPRLWAQTLVISNASNVALLQDGLIGGFTNILLQFTGNMYPTGVLEVVEDVTIDGTGYNPILGGTSNLVFYVDPGVHFKLINVTLSGAFNAGSVGVTGSQGGNGGTKGAAGGNGGAGSNALGGAVYNAGNSTFINCLFYTNFAVGGAGGAGGVGGNGSSTGGNGGNGGAGGKALGGAIYNIGTILLSNCSVAGNQIVGGTGGAGGTNGSGGFTSYAGLGAVGGIVEGAGIYNLGIAHIINTTINQNTAVAGAADTSGGGAPSGNGNGVTGPTGAGAYGAGSYNNGTNTFLNCTFFANTATGGSGGTGGNGNNYAGNGGNGGYAFGANVYNDGGGILAMTNCTIAGGMVTGGTNGVAGTGAYAGNNGSTGLPAGANIANNGANGAFLFKNSILDYPTNATSANGSITDQGNNISSDSTPGFNTTNSFNNEDPLLSPSGLQPNGSSVVLTIALSANSPAINAIYDNSAPSYDERDFIRPIGPRSDIGAFEFGSFSASFNVSGVVMAGNSPFPGVTVSAGVASSSITDSNGVFELALQQSNFYSIAANPRGYFSPSGYTVDVISNITGLVFHATNSLTITNVSVSTNTNTLSLTFSNVPGFNYIIQAATNLAASPVIWTNLATNNSGTNGVFTFTYELYGTNLTNIPQIYFRAVP